MAEEIKLEIVAGHIKPVIEPKFAKAGLIDTVVHKQEMYGSGDMKAHQTELEEIKAVQEAKAEEEAKVEAEKTQAATATKTVTKKAE